MESTDPHAVTLKKKAALARWAALLFLLFIGLVIIGADNNTLPGYIRALYRFPNGDLAGHFMLYGILAFLACRAFQRRFRLGKTHLSLAALLTAGLAIAEELSQFAFVQRTPSLLDVSCSLLGVLVGARLAGRF